jgi:hypothetical protein
MYVKIHVRKIIGASYSQETPVYTLYNDRVLSQRTYHLCQFAQTYQFDIIPPCAATSAIQAFIDRYWPFLFYIIPRLSLEERRTNNARSSKAECQNYGSQNQDHYVGIWITKCDATIR